MLMFRLNPWLTIRPSMHNCHAKGNFAYFDRPQLDDGLRITVGTDDEIDELLRRI